MLVPAAAHTAASSPPGQGTLLVGAASTTVLPLVNGSYDYLKAGFPGRKDAYDPGIPVAQWDDGRIAVGNGERDSYWVHDDIRATALAIDDPRSPDIVVIVATDLYMVFRNDGEEIRAKATALLPPGTRRSSGSSSPRRTTTTDRTRPSTSTTPGTSTWSDRWRPRWPPRSRIVVPRACRSRRASTGSA